MSGKRTGSVESNSGLKTCAACGGGRRWRPESPREHPALHEGHGLKGRVHKGGPWMDTGMWALSQEYGVKSGVGWDTASQLELLPVQC